MSKTFLSDHNKPAGIGEEIPAKTAIIFELENGDRLTIYHNEFGGIKIRKSGNAIDSEQILIEPANSNVIVVK